MAATAEPTELLLLLQAGSGRTAQVFALLFGLLQDSFIGQRAQPAQQLSIHLLPVILPVKRTLLLALLTRVRRAVLLLGVGAPLAFVSNKCCYNVAVLAGFRL